MITLHTLGDAAIGVGDREVRPTSPAMFAALLYLGVERGQRVPRAALQGLLFPEAGERSGAHSLRQLLYKLRQLGAPIQAEGDVVSLPAEAVADDYSNGNGNDAHGRARFLETYAPRISDAFDEWLDRKRAQIGTGLRRSLAAKMSARRDAADWAAVERIAREILAADEFNEEATLALAEATALSGSKAEAVRILERYEGETGHSDLKLNASILRRRISERLPESRRRPLDTPFLGREPEAEAMREAVLQLRGGTAGTVVIVGEPGIGKSRLLEEAGALATLEGVNVQVMRCQPHYGSRPMGVFIELVPALLACRGALGVAPEMLEHLTLLTSHRDDRANRPSDARDDSTRSGILLAAVRDLVDAVSGEAPLLVAVEDAHWADPTSLTELSALASGSRGRSLLVVYTTRQLEPLKQAGVVTDATPVFRLKPLADEAMKTLSGHLLPSLVSSASHAEVAKWCAETAAGNPFYLQVLCAHYEDTQQAFAVPPSMRSALTRRIELLPKNCRRLLELSALLGPHSRLDTMRELTELTDVSFIEAIQRLEEEGYLRTSAGAALVAHDVLRECTLELIPPLTKSALHGQVAANLEARYDSNHDAALLWDCAAHWAASGDASKAFRFVVRCARHTADMGRAVQAADILRRGDPYATTVDDRLFSLREQARVLKAAANWSGLLATAEQIASITGAGTAADIDWQCEFWRVEARWAVEFVEDDSIPKLLAYATSPQAPPAIRTDASLLLLRVSHEQANAEMAHSAFNAVSSLVTSQGVVYSARMLPLIYHTSFGDLSQAAFLARRLKEDLGLLPIADRMRAAKNLSVALNCLGQEQEALELGRSYYERAVSLDLPQYQYDFCLGCCQTATNMEDYPEAEAWLDRSRDIGHKAGLTQSAFGQIVIELDIAIHAADTERAKAGLQSLLNAPTGSSVRGRGALLAYRVRVLQLDMDYRSDDDELLQLSGMLRTVEKLSGSDSLAIALCEALRRRGDHAGMKRVLSDYLSARREQGSIAYPLRQLLP